MAIILMITNISIVMIISIIIMMMNMIKLMMLSSQEITSAIFDSIDVKSHM